MLFKSPGLFNTSIPEFNNIRSEVDLITDIKVSFPCSFTYLNLNSHKKVGAAGEDAHKKKIRKYTPELLKGRAFLPLSIESFGRFHPSMKLFLSALCGKAANISGIPKSCLVSYWTHRISFTLHRNIAQMVVSRVDSIRAVRLEGYSAKANHTIPKYDDFSYPR